MFWHSAAALGQQYWLVPVPQSYWMQGSMEVRRGPLFLGSMPARRGAHPSLHGAPAVLSCVHASQLSQPVPRAVPSAPAGWRVCVACLDKAPLEAQGASTSRVTEKAHL